MIERFRVIRKDGMRRRFSGLRENEALSQLSYPPSYGSKNLTAKIPTRRSTSGMVGYSEVGLSA